MVWEAQINQQVDDFRYLDGSIYAICSDPSAKPSSLGKAVVYRDTYRRLGCMAMGVFEVIRI